ncbi:MAG TPA: PQQ-binding-like beta-propeller repeat protein [Acidimicrobiales bacterium]|nr:PQQ-binding-like beta-propeller repeat protein [Acidimicrobiales bacterium]
MRRSRRALAVVAVALAGVLIGGTVTAAGPSDRWVSAGHDLHNTRNQDNEHKIGVGNVAGLQVKWAFTTGGDVSATPAVDGTTVYVPDWAGNLFAVDRKTGQQVWRASIPAASGLPGDKARATPVITGNKVIVGTQGLGSGTKMLAFNKNTGALMWSTTIESHFASIVTQSAVAHGSRLYVGVSSLEESLAAFIPGYICCTFRGSMLALDVNTGKIVWKTYLAPAGYSGNAVWGSTPAIDTSRGQVYIATGNNYSVPAAALSCVAGLPPDDPARRDCLAPDDHFDSIVALDLKTGAIRWVTQALPFDAWTVDCIPIPGANGTNCPDPEGPDYDFGQGPALFTVRPNGNGTPRDLVGAGQKSGQYWAVDPDTGAVVWVTQAGPGGTAGGLQWGSAVDGTRVYTANANSLHTPWTLTNNTVTTDGVWSGLDAATGAILWQVTPSHPNSPTAPGGATSGPVSSANGVVYGCSLDPQGYMYALDGRTGQELWSFASGGSCLSGAAIADGTVFWGSGYSNLGFGTPNNKLYAFGLP